MKVYGENGVLWRTSDEVELGGGEGGEAMVGGPGCWTSELAGF